MIRPTSYESLAALIEKEDKLVLFLRQTGVQTVNLFILLCQKLKQNLQI